MTSTARRSRGVIEIAKLRHGGGCNDAPGALVNLLRTASQGELKLQVRAAPELINISDENLFRYHLVFMHGRHDFRLTTAEREQLREYLERGGTLLADSICASKPFAAAFRRELAAALPGQTLERIPPDDPLFTDSVRRLRHPPGLAARSRKRSATTSPSPPASARSSRSSKASRSTAAGPSSSRRTTSAARWKATKPSAAAATPKQDAARIGLNVLLYSLNQ